MPPNGVGQRRAPRREMARVVRARIGAAGGGGIAGGIQELEDQFKLNGGYVSVSSRRYPLTRTCQRRAPLTKSNIPRGKRPVNRIANHAMNASTCAASMMKF